MHRSLDDLRRRVLAGDADAAGALRDEARRRGDRPLQLLAASALADIATLQLFVRDACRTRDWPALEASADCLGLVLDEQTCTRLETLVSKAQRGRTVRLLRLDDVLGAAVAARHAPLGFALAHGGVDKSRPGALSSLCLAARLHDSHHVVVGLTTSFASNPSPGRAADWGNALKPWSSDLARNRKRVLAWASANNVPYRGTIRGCALAVPSTTAAPAAAAAVAELDPSDPALRLLELALSRIDPSERWRSTTHVIDQRFGERRRTSAAQRQRDEALLQTLLARASDGLSELDPRARYGRSPADASWPLAAGFTFNRHFPDSPTSAWSRLEHAFVWELSPALIDLLASEACSRLRALSVPFRPTSEAWSALLDQRELLARLRGLELRLDEEADVSAIGTLLASPMALEQFAVTGEPATALERLGLESLARHPLRELDLTPSEVAPIARLFEALDGGLVTLALGPAPSRGVLRELLELVGQHSKLRALRDFTLRAPLGEGLLGVAVTAAEVAPLAPALAHLEALTLTSGEQGTVARLLEAAGHAPRLRTLRVRGMLDEADIAALASIPSALEVLDLSGTTLGNNGVAALAAAPALSRLRRLVVSGCGITGRGVTAFVRAFALGCLEELRLTMNALRETGLQALGEWPGLAQLRLLAVDREGPKAARHLIASPHLRGEVEGIPALEQRVPSL